MITISRAALPTYYSIREVFKQFALRWDCTTRFGNYIFYSIFFKNSLEFITVYIIRNGIAQGTMVMLIFTKNPYIWENHKKQTNKQNTFFFCCFLKFLSKQTRKNKILNVVFKISYWFKHSLRCCVFSFFQDFADLLSFMPNKAKTSFFTKFSIFWP